MRGFKLSLRGEGDQTGSLEIILEKRSGMKARLGLLCLKERDKS